MMTWELAFIISNATWLLLMLIGVSTSLRASRKEAKYMARLEAENSALRQRVHQLLRKRA